MAETGNMNGGYVFPIMENNLAPLVFERRADQCAETTPSVSGASAAVVVFTGIPPLSIADV